MNKLRIIKSRLFDTQSPLFKWEFWACVLFIFLAAYLLAPRYWEPGGESLKNWVSARIFRQGWGFPVLHHAPLYNLYLQFFLFFDYPLSIQLEHFVTHIFTYTSIFLLLRRFLPTAPALLLTCAWIPTLWTMEGGARVAGIGFFALYLQTNKKSAFNNGYLPASLGAAALFEAAYIPFLLGHAVGTFFERRSNKEPMITFKYPISRERIIPVIVKATLVLLVVLTICFQSKRLDNNAPAFFYPWAPFPQTHALTIACLQTGNWNYVTRNFPESEWIQKDWYFTHKEAFGGAQSLLQAVINKPETFFRLIISNVHSGMLIPPKFFVGFLFPPNLIWMLFFLIAWVFLPFGFYRLYQYYKTNNLVPHNCSIAFGISAVVAILSLVYFADRYLAVLLPVGLIMTAHAGSSLQSFLRSLYREMSRQFNGILNSNDDSAGSNSILIIGSMLIIAGFLANEWTLTALLSTNGAVLLSSRILIWFIDLFLIIGGIFLILKRHLFFTIVKQIKASNYSNSQSWFTNVIILFLAGCVLFPTYNSYNKIERSNGLLVNPFKLYGSMASVQSELLASLNKQTKVLAQEEPWIRSFGDVDLDKVFHPMFLPPFKDTSGETNKFLKSLHVIWVSHDFSRKEALMSTQRYLRYHLHVEPFLENALKNGWTMQEVEGFGKIYRRPLSE